MPDQRFRRDLLSPPCSHPDRVTSIPNGSVHLCHPVDSDVEDTQLPRSEQRPVALRHQSRRFQTRGALHCRTVCHPGYRSGRGDAQPQSGAAASPALHPSRGVHIPDHRERSCNRAVFDTSGYWLRRRSRRLEVAVACTIPPSVVFRTQVREPLVALRLAAQINSMSKCVGDCLPFQFISHRETTPAHKPFAVSHLVIIESGTVPYDFSWLNGRNEGFSLIYLGAQFRILRVE